MLRIGVDVGGTNTDAVLMDGERLLAACKAGTTADIQDGIVNAVSQVMKDAAIGAYRVRAVMIGTTQFTNALIEARGLQRVGVVRIALPAARGVPPLTEWPHGLCSAIEAMVFEIGGGHRFDGNRYAPLDERALVDTAQRFAAAEIGSVAISGVFSAVNPELEKRAAALLSQRLPQARITCSSEIGRLGLVERENAAVLNAALNRVAERVIEGFGTAFANLGIRAPLFISQNDGTLMSLARARRYPVLSFASGPTNSMRGAGYLTGIRDGIVADIGGTTTDVGVLSGGFPRESSLSSDIAGVRTNFRMPDVHAIGLGGGSRVRFGTGGPSIGPDSVGYELAQKAWCFGGDTLTLTDVAIRAGRLALGDLSWLDGIDDATCRDVLQLAQGMLADAVDRVRTGSDPLPVILVGGGSRLVEAAFDNASHVVRPNHAGVANAIGAAIAQVGGEVDRMVSLAGERREDVLEVLKRDAIAAALRAGAREGSARIVDIDETPMTYLPGEHARFRVRAVGDLTL